MSSGIKLIAGLGNPGPEYVHTRHNAGWSLIDAFVGRLGLGVPRIQFEGSWWSAVPVEGERAAFLKPHTYMNLSGKSVAAAANYLDIDPSDILIISDDVALPFGALRYRDGGTAGGQNGLKSILGALGTLDVPRLRAGVGAPRPGFDMKDWVLSRLTASELDEWPKVEELAWSSMKRWLRGEAGEGFTVRIAPEETRG